MKFHKITTYEGNYATINERHICCIIPNIEIFPATDIEQERIIIDSYSICITNGVKIKIKAEDYESIDWMLGLE